MPALHALVVGVSAYPHLPGGDGEQVGVSQGMRQLSATATSAVELKRWLEEAAPRLPVPLGSVRLLLSPSPAELAVDPTLADGAREATRERFREEALAWRKVCAEDPENIALFYFAGHGVQRSNSDMVLLLSDFADAEGNPLANAVDVHNLFGGMAVSASRPAMARTQLWFVDACRNYPAQFRGFAEHSATQIFDVELLDGPDTRCAPIYFGALPGGSAYSMPGDRTLFSRALFEALEHSGGTKLEGSNSWVVTPESLLVGMKEEMRRLNLKYGADQVIWNGGQLTATDSPILEMAGVPEVEVSFRLVPDQAASGVQVAVRDPAGNPKLGPGTLDPNPFLDRWQAGIYQLETSPTLPDAEPYLPIRPPRYRWEAEVP
jgi:hypothetical protein